MWLKVTYQEYRVQVSEFTLDMLKEIMQQEKFSARSKDHWLSAFQSMEINTGIRFLGIVFIRVRGKYE